MHRRAFLSSSFVVASAGCLRLTETSSDSSTAEGDRPTTEQGEATTRDTTAEETGASGPDAFESMSEAWTSRELDLPRYTNFEDTVVADGNLYAGGSEGISVIDLDGPEVVASRTLERAVDTVEVGSSVFAGTAPLNRSADRMPKVHKLDASTLEADWSFTVPRPSEEAMESDGPTSHWITDIEVSEDAVFVSAVFRGENLANYNQSYFHVLDRESGDPIFSYECEADGVMESLVVHDGTVCIGHFRETRVYDVSGESVADAEFEYSNRLLLEDGTLFSVGDGLQVIDLQDGSPRFSTRLDGSQFSRPALFDDTVVVPTINGIYGLDAETGGDEWEVRITGEGQLQPAVHDRGFAFAADTEGFLYGIDVESGTLVYDERVLEGVNDVAVFEDTVIVSDEVTKAYEIAWAE